MYPKYLNVNTPESLLVETLVSLAALTYTTDEIKSALNTLDKDMLIEVIIQDMQLIRDNLELYKEML